MTYRTGFAVTQDLSLFNWRLENATGKPLLGSVGTPPRATRGTMLEIDTKRGRVRMQFGRGVYLATDLTPDLRRTVINLAEYATKAIAAILRAQDVDPVRSAATGWVDSGRRFCWTRNLPWQLELLDLQAGQQFRALRVTNQELFCVTADDARTFEWAVPLGDITLEDIAVEHALTRDDAGFLDDRQWSLAS